MSLKLKHFFDTDTSTLTYVVYDEKTKDALVIDPVLDYDPAASKVSTESVDVVEKFLKDKDLQLQAILETHVHADHLTGAMEVKKRFPNARIGIGGRIKLVQETFKDIYNLKEHIPDGSQFDFLLMEGETLSFGSIKVETLFTPGHTPACSSYKIGDRLFTGDALFMPDSGTGRCDFPGGSAKELYNSVHNKIYKLDDSIKVYPGHDYQPEGRELKFESSVKEQKEQNIHIQEDTTEEEFIKFRTERDKTLSAPRLLLPSLQINIEAGELPQEEENGMKYLKIPLR
jgi:glyoxylase-like metal-dependent hydrolase (beta-lactamase superfamily II)